MGCEKFRWRMQLVAVDFKYWLKESGRVVTGAQPGYPPPVQAQGMADNLVPTVPLGPVLGPRQACSYSRSRTHHLQTGSEINIFPMD
jgi:hypothetical protein